MIQPYQIKEIINDHFNLKIERRTRKRIYCEARFTYYFLCREQTSQKLNKIAREINYNHASVIHGIKMTRILKEVDKKFLKNFNEVRSKVISLNSGDLQKVEVNKPNIIHPYRFRDVKQLRKILVKRG
jgi:transcriptional regulator NrdR family protein